MQQAIRDIIAIMKEPLRTFSFFSYGDATKNAFNHISLILQRSTSQPRLQIFPLPPMLPQSQNANIQHQKTISTPAPSLRVQPVLQPMRVQTQDSAPTQPPRYRPSIPPQLGSTFKSMD